MYMHEIVFKGVFYWCQFSKTVDLEDSEFVFDCLPNSKNDRFGRFGMPAKPSAQTGRRFGRLWRDHRNIIGEILTFILKL